MADPAGRPGAIDVLGIGNALVDVLSHASDALVAGRGLAKGTMRLVGGMTGAEAVRDGLSDHDSGRSAATIEEP